MADFRKWFPVLVVVALLLGSAVSASAQQTQSTNCFTNAGVPPLLRAEGLTELVGDLILNCTGGDTTKPFNANFQIFLNTNITSRILTATTTLGGTSFKDRVEALLIIDDMAPTPSATAGGPVVGVAGKTNADGTTTLGTGNIFIGAKAADNSVVWLGVPFYPPGSGTRIIRVTNVRANASALLPPGSTSVLPPYVQAYISISGSQSVPVNNPNQIIGYVTPGLDFAIRKCDDSGSAGTDQLNYLQCVSQNKDPYTDTGKTFTAQFAVRFKELFATSFKTQFALGQTDSQPGVVYNSESGFIKGALGTEIGYATQATRLMATFSNIPSGVKIAVAVTNTLSTTATAAASLVSGYDANGYGGTFYTGATQTVSCSNSANMAVLTITGGTATAIWEVTAANAFSADSYTFPVAVSYVANTSSNIPGLTTGTTIAGMFAPNYVLPTGTTMSNSLPVPRFAASPINKTIFRIDPCATNLLFPFVTNKAGFDSGLAISNTSLDPFGTSTQSGSCRINYYSNPAPSLTYEDSSTVVAGDTLTMTLSSGNPAFNIKGNPGFQGYIIAQCKFQYAHGFAFITDLGAQRLAEGYLALVLDAALAARGSTSEVLGN